MKIIDLLSMCLRNLTRRKFRTFLTVSGVVIGTTSIVIMISLGVGISSSYDEMLRSFGDLTVIEVRSQSQEIPLDDTAVETMQGLPGVVIASPVMRLQINSWTQFTTGRKDRYSSTWMNLNGVLPGALEKLGYKAEKGNLDIGSDAKTIKIVMGSNVPYNFEDTKKRWPNNMINAWVEEGQEKPDPFFDAMESDFIFKVHPSKDKAKILEYKIKVTGMLEGKDNDWETLESVYMSIDDMKRIKAEYDKENGIKKDKNVVQSYDQVKVKVDNIDSVKAVQDTIKDMQFYVYSMEEMRQGLQENMAQIQMILGILGGVSLFVAAISIINTMLMSVYERTREIGVMKVLGCLVGNIRSVFLIEAGMIGFLGGVVGILVSYLLSFLFNRFGGSFGSGFGMMMPQTDGAKLSIIPPWLVLMGLSVATVIGIIAGFYPANRAVRISALEAIKTE